MGVRCAESEPTTGRGSLILSRGMLRDPCRGRAVGEGLLLRHPLESGPSCKHPVPLVLPPSHRAYWYRQWVARPDRRQVKGPYTTAGVLPSGIVSRRGEVHHLTDPDWDAGRVGDEAKVKLLRLIGQGDRLDYVYDFGGNWGHTLTVKWVAAAEPGVRYPRCVAGQRGCPPEDVRGPWRYGGYLEVMAAPSHPDHDERVEWVGGVFNLARSISTRSTRPWSGWFGGHCQRRRRRRQVGEALISARHSAGVGLCGPGSLRWQISVQARIGSAESVAWVRS